MINKKNIVYLLWLEQKGRNKVVGRVLTIGTFLASVFTFVKIQGINLSYLQMGVISVSVMFITVILGILYAKYLLSDELELEMEVNKHFMKMYNKITDDKTN